MIVERLANPAVAAALPAGVRQAWNYLRMNDMQAMAPGRHEIDGDRLFVLVQEYTTRPPGECVWEAHRRYIDVQHVVWGEERMGYANIAHVRERESYDPARDVAFFEPGTDFITVHAGMVAIFGPEDVHSPCGAARVPALVRKAVVKVLLTT